jgi:hypothetical protein
MRSTTHRRLCGALGAGLVLLCGAGVALVGTALFRVPATTVQVVLVGVAGLLDLVAAFETPLTARVDWFRLSGAGNVALGLALPIGMLGWESGTVLFVASAVGGLALAAIGVDIVVYAGSHVYERRLDACEPE